MSDIKKPTDDTEPKIFGINNGYQGEKQSTMQFGPAIIPMQDLDFEELDRLKNEIRFLKAVSTTLTNNVNMLMSGLTEAEQALAQNYAVINTIAETFCKKLDISKKEFDELLKETILSKQKDNIKCQKTSDLQGKNLNPG